MPVSSDMDSPPFTRWQADLILHVGLNARLEATMLNVRIRQRWLRGGLTVGTIGAPVRLTYDHQNLGLTPASLLELASGNHPFCEVWTPPVDIVLVGWCREILYAGRNKQKAERCMN